MFIILLLCLLYLLVIGVYVYFFYYGISEVLQAKMTSQGGGRWMEMWDISQYICGSSWKFVNIFEWLF